MPAVVIIGLLIGVPAVIIFFLRANAAIVFLSLCAGSVLAQFVSGDSVKLVNSFTASSNTVNADTIRLALLYTPAFFTTLFVRGKVHGVKNTINLILALSVGIVGVLLAVPLMPGGIRHNITSSNIWPTVEQYQAVIVAIAIVLSLLSLWFNKPGHGKDKKPKHK